MASVATPPVVSNSFSRSLSIPLEDTADSMLDIFGNPVFSGCDSENVDQFSQSWYCVADAEKRHETQAQAKDRKVSSTKSHQSVPRHEPFNVCKQCVQREVKDMEGPCVTEMLSQNCTRSDQNLREESCDSLITPSPKLLGARPKVFTNSKGKTRLKSHEREKKKKESNVEDFGTTPIKPKSTKGKKKNIKIRVKSTKKWKPVDMSEFGFNFSRVSQLDLIENEIDEDIAAAAVSFPSESLHEEVHSSAPSDDAEFFLSLGIDVYAEHDDYQSDAILDWDGVDFLDQSRRSKDTPPRPSQEKSGKGKHFVKENKPALLKKDKATGVNPIFESKSPQSSSRRVDNVIRKCDKYSLYELECSSKKKVYIRRDKHRRVEKVHKAVKSKNLVSIFNNRGHKRLYMHHRLIKMHNLCLDFRSSPRCMPVPPMSKSKVDLDAAKQVFNVNHNSSGGAPNRAAPAQNLRHTLHESNAPNHLDLDLASFLISLQHREMTPEDYEMLLRLDDTVKPKTVSENILELLKTDTVGPEGVGGDDDDIILCAICMDPYVPGDRRKFLPCGHDFHAACVDTWLKNSSMNCPLDGLPVESS